MGQNRRLLNLLSATNDLDTLTADLKNQVAADQLTKLSDIRDSFISFPLSQAPKSNSEWRRIYHLSYLRGRLVKCYIQKEWDIPKYTIFDETKQEII